MEGWEMRGMKCNMCGKKRKVVDVLNDRKDPAPGN